MKTLNSKWFECKVRYDKIMGNGTQKKVTEQYVVDAYSFSEAEANIAEAVTPCISGEFDIVAEKIAPYKEVFFTENPADDKWYHVKINLITFDEKTGKEKKNAIHHLVQSNTFENARKNISEVYDKTMMDFKIAKISETNILDVFEHEV